MIFISKNAQYYNVKAIKAFDTRCLWAPKAGPCVSMLLEATEELTRRRPSGPHAGTLLEANRGNFADEGWVNERASSREINGARYFAKGRCTLFKPREIAKVNESRPRVVIGGSPAGGSR